RPWGGPLRARVASTPTAPALHRRSAGRLVLQASPPELRASFAERALVAKVAPLPWSRGFCVGGLRETSGSCLLFGVRAKNGVILREHAESLEGYDRAIHGLRGHIRTR